MKTLGAILAQAGTPSAWSVNYFSSFTFHFHAMESAFAMPHCSTAVAAAFAKEGFVNALSISNMKAEDIQAVKSILPVLSLPEVERSFAIAVPRCQRSERAFNPSGALYATVAPEHRADQSSISASVLPPLSSPLEGSSKRPRLRGY